MSDEAVTPFDFENLKKLIGEVNSQLEHLKSFHKTLIRTDRIHVLPAHLNLELSHKCPMCGTSLDDQGQTQLVTAF